MKQAVIYARYSCDKQTEQSIEGQLHICKDFAERNGYNIVDSYIDRATSGTNDHRPAFQTMIKDSKQHLWQYIIVYKGDRFSRNRYESATYKKQLRDNGVKLISATENIPDTPEGIILESLLEGMAEYYSAELSQKVKRGMAESKRKGQFTGGNLLFGYDVDAEKHIVVNEYEASIVNKIYNDYLVMDTAGEIANSLNAQGIKTKQGKPFTDKHIYKIVGNATYTGQGLYPPIISEKQFSQVQSRKRIKRKAQRASAGYILTGKLVCGDCGSIMTGECGTGKSGNTYHYYSCQNIGKANCNSKRINKDYLESLVIDTCNSILHKGFIPAIVNKAYDLHQAEKQNNAVVESIEAEIKEKEKSIDNIVDAIANGFYSDKLKDKMRILEEDLHNLKSRLQQEEASQGNNYTKEDFEAFLLEIMSRRDRKFDKSVIELLIRQIIVFDDRICIMFNYSPQHKNIKTDEKLRAEFTAITSEEDSVRLLSCGGLARSIDEHTTISVFVKPDYWGVWASKKR